MKTTEPKFRKDASMPFQTWLPFALNDRVEVENAYGDKSTGVVKDLWWGYEQDMGGIAEGVIVKATKLPEVPSFEYFDQDEDEAEMATWYEFDAYQDFTDTTAIYPEDLAEDYLMYGLMSEVGEMAGKIKKEIRDSTEFTDEDFIKELGDALWYVAQLAANRGYRLSDIAQANVEKLSDRKGRGVIGGSGDER